MQLKVVWNLRLHADSEGPTLIFDTALRRKLTPSRIRDTLTTCIWNRPDQHSARIWASINCIYRPRQTGITGQWTCIQRGRPAFDLRQPGI